MKRNGGAPGPRDPDGEKPSTSAVFEFLYQHGRGMPSHDEGGPALYTTAIQFSFDSKRTMISLEDTMFPAAPPGRHILVYSVVNERWRTTATVGIRLKIEGQQDQIERTWHTGGAKEPFTDTLLKGKCMRESKFYMHFVGEPENPTRRLFPDVTAKDVEDSIIKHTRKGVEYMLIDEDSAFGKILNLTKSTHKHNTLFFDSSNCYCIPKDDVKLAGKYTGQYLLDDTLADIKLSLVPRLPSTIQCSCTKLTGADIWETEMHLVFIYSVAPVPEESHLSIAS